MLGDAVVGEFLLGVEVIVFREVADDRPRQNRQVVGGGVVVLRRPAGGVHEVGVVHAQFAGLVVHQIGEGFLGAGHVLGQGDAGVIAGLNHHPFQQILHRYPGAFLNEHTRTAHAPRFNADRHHLLFGDIAGGDLLLHQIGGHHLGETGRRQLLIGVVFDDHLAAFGVHQQIAARVHVGGARDQAVGGAQRRQGEQGNTDEHPEQQGLRGKVLSHHFSLTGESVHGDG